VNYQSVKYIATAVLCAFVASCGIHHSASVNDPLPADQLAQVLQQSFQTADGAVREAVNKIVQEMKDHNVAAGFKDVKDLAAEPNLTQDQRITAIRAGNTIGQLLQEAAQNGDDKAAETMHSYNGSH
jgi:hypothetical protein